MGDSTNPFDQFKDPNWTPPQAAPADAAPPAANPFDQFKPPNFGPPVTSAPGAFVRGALPGIAPNLAGMAGAGFGAEAGGELGAAAGAFAGPFAEVASPVLGGIGAIGGGLAGYFGAFKGASAAQGYVTQQLPITWQDELGTSERQQRIDQQQHPTASFLGGMAPFALTMRPGGFARAALPADATAFQRIAANPWTSRLFAGAVQGGMTLGQEKIQGQSPDWADIAMATGFGMIFNKPWGFGTNLEKMGAELYPRMSPNARFNFEGAPIGPTLADAADLKVAGPGITEAVSQGEQQQSPETEQQAQTQAATEQSIMSEPTGPDIHAIARQMEPETFAQYDALQEQANDLRAFIAGEKNPDPDTIQAAKNKLDYYTGQLEDAQSSGGARGRQIPRLRALVADAQSQFDDLNGRAQAWASGAAQDTPAAASARAKFAELSRQIMDMGVNQIAPLYRRAAETPDGMRTQPVDEIPPSPQIAPEPAVSPVENVGETPAPSSPVKSIEAQHDTIVAERSAQLRSKGQSPELADANARIEAAAYVAHAARFKGALGGPEDIYRREAPDLRGAAPASPLMPTPEKPAIASAAGREFVGTVRRAVEGGLDTGANLGGAELGAAREREAELTQEEIKPEPDADPKLFGRQASITTNAGRRIIELFKNSDASSMVHELAHDWLFRILRDAEHPLAPVDLKTDATTIKRALGIKDKSELLTLNKKGNLTGRARAANEQFAHWFEQYLREGVAPSRSLAGVFAKFKNWLTQIYKTIKDLGQPINDDIRQVFDRMLAENPERTVIAPERPAAPSLADIHEADAEETAPREAESAGDRVVAERDQYTKGQPPEIADETAATKPAETGNEPAGEAGASSSGPSEVDANRAESEPVPGGAASGVERGEVQRGGGAAVSEGDRVRPVAAGSGPGDRSGVGAFAPRPKEQLPEPESPFVDKAGNIRVENLTDKESVARAIYESAERNDEFKHVTGPSVTKGMLNDLADSMGWDAKNISEATLINAFGGVKDLAKKVLAARKLIIQSADIVSEAFAKAADGTDEDLVAMAAAITRHDMIQSYLAGVTAEWGRAGNAFHSLLTGWDKVQTLNQFLKDNTGRDLYQLKKMAKLGAQYTEPGQVSKLIRDKPSLGKAILESWINGLVSGISTHVTYTIGNGILWIERNLIEAELAERLGQSRTGRDGEVIPIGEARARRQSAWRGLPGAVKATVDAARLGYQVALPGESAAPELPFDVAQFGRGTEQYNIDATWKDVAGSIFAFQQGLKDGIKAVSALVKAGEGSWTFRPGSSIPDYQTAQGGVIPIHAAMTGGYRLVATVHSLFRCINYSTEIGGLAFRQATREGLTGDALGARVADLRSNPSPDMMDEATRNTNDLTLMGHAGKWTQQLAAMVNTPVDLPLFGETPILKFVDPFVRIGSNIVKQGITERTPLGVVFSKELRADLWGENGNIAQDNATARMMAGTALVGLFGTMAAAGWLSGSGPSDPKMNAVWRIAGNQAHSIRIGNMWFQVNRLGPMGMLASLSADLYDVGYKLSEGQASAAGGALLHAVAQNVLDQSFMTGPAEWMDAIENSDSKGQAFVQKTLASFLPYSVGMAQMAKAMDPYQRQTRSILDAFKAEIPGLSESLLPRRDIWGRPIPNASALFGRGLTAIYEQEINTDPVNQAMLNLGVNLGQPERKIRGVTLTDQQYDDYQRIAGVMTKQRLNVIVNSPDFRYWSPDMQHDVISETVTQCRETARNIMMMKYGSIAYDATLARMKRASAQ